MAKKPAKPFRIPVLQRFKVREIDDPTEQAELDERIKRSRIVDNADVDSDGKYTEADEAGGRDCALLIGSWSMATVLATDLPR